MPQQDLFERYRKMRGEAMGLTDGPSIAERLERKRIQRFLDSIGDMPEDEGMHPGFSPVGKRRSHLEKFASSLTQPGRQWLEGQVREQLEADNEIVRKIRENLMRSPDAADRRTAEWSRLYQTMGDPVGSMTLGWFHSPWVKEEDLARFQEGERDALVRIIVDEERKKGTPEEELLAVAMERIDKNDIPSGIKWAQRSAVIPELAYMLLPFAGWGKATARLLAPLKIGARVEAGWAGSGIAAAARHAPALGRYAEQIAHSAATFGAVEASRKPHPGDPGIVARALHGAKTGATVGLVASPVAQTMMRYLPSWMQGSEAYWARAKFEKVGGKGPFQIMRSAGDGKNWVFRDTAGKEWKVNLAKEAQSAQEKIGRWLDVPGRAAEAAAFVGMSAVNGVEDSEELLFSAMLGASMPTIIGRPLARLRKHIPGTAEYRNEWARMDLIADAKLRTKQQKYRAETELRSAKRLRSKIDPATPGKTGKEAGREGEIVPMEGRFGMIVKEGPESVTLFDGQNMVEVPKDGAPAAVRPSEISDISQIDHLAALSESVSQALAKSKKGNSNLRRRAQNLLNLFSREVAENEAIIRREGQAMEAMPMIRSGGQTGADLGGLEGATRAGARTGGVAPKGYRSEIGQIPNELKKYGLTEHVSADYRARTRQNVAESDATVIFVKDAENMSPGSRQTLEYAKAENKPVIVNPSPAELADFIVEHGVRDLNVAGSRESKAKGIQKRVSDHIHETLGLVMQRAGSAPITEPVSPEAMRQEMPAVRGDIKERAAAMRAVLEKELTGEEKPGASVQMEGEVKPEELTLPDDPASLGKLMRRVVSVTKVEMVPVSEFKTAAEEGKPQTMWRIKIMEGSIIPASTSPNPEGGRMLPPQYVEPRNWEYGQPVIKSYLTSDPAKARLARAQMKKTTGKKRRPKDTEEVKKRKLGQAEVADVEGWEASTMEWPGEMNSELSHTIGELLHRIKRVRSYLEAPVEAGGFDPHVPDAVRNRESLVMAERELLEGLDSLLQRDGGRHYTLEDYLRIRPEYLKDDPFVKLIRQNFPHWNEEASMWDFKPPHSQKVAEQAGHTLKGLLDDESWTDIAMDVEKKVATSGFGDMAPVFYATAQMEAARTVKEWVTTDSTPINREVALSIIRENVTNAVMGQLRQEHAFRRDHPEFPMEKKSQGLAVMRIKQRLRGKLRKKLESALATHEDNPEAAARKVMQYVERQIDGELLKRLEESSPEFSQLSDNAKEFVLQLTLDRISRDMYPRGKTHPGTTYAQEAWRTLGLRSKGDAMHVEAISLEKKLRQHFEPHVQRMMNEWNSIYEGAKLGLERGPATGNWQGFLEMMVSHPVATAGVATFSLLGVANTLGAATIGGSLLAGAGFTVPLGAAIGVGWRGKRRMEAKLRSKQAGWLRWMRDSLEEPDSITTIEDLARKGDIGGMKRLLGWGFGMPETLFGTAAIEPFMAAQLAIHSKNTRDRAWFFEGSKRKKAIFYGVEEGTALSKLLGRYLDYFRADNGGRPMGDVERTKKLNEELYARDSFGTRIYSSEDIKAFEYAAKGVRRWLDRMRYQLGKVFEIDIDKVEFGIDGYFPRIFEMLQGDASWKDKIGSWFSSKDITKLPSVLNRRVSDRGDYNPDAAFVMRVMAPAFRRILELRKAANKMAPFLYGHYEPIGKYIETISKEKYPTPKGKEGRAADLLAKMQANVAVRNRYGLKQLEKLLKVISKEALMTGSSASRVAGRRESKLGVRFDDTGDSTWVIDGSYRAGDSRIAFRRDDIPYGSYKGKKDEAFFKKLDAGELINDGYRRLTVDDFLRIGQVRVGGLVQAGLPNRVAEAERFANWAVGGEKYHRLWHNLEKYLGGVAYYATIGSFNPRPASHNLIGGQWLNFTELGIRYAMDGARLATEAAREPESYYGRILKRSQIMAEGTYMWQDYRGTQAGKLLQGLDKFGYFWFRGTENYNRASAFLGGFQRAMDRMHIKHGEAKTEAEKHRRENQAIIEGQRAVRRTVAMYGAFNAPGMFRHPAGRLFLHLNRFTVLQFNRVVDMAARAKTHQDYQRLLRLIVGSAIIYQLGTMCGQDMHFIFGQQAEDLGEPLLYGGIGDTFTALRAPSPHLWELAVRPSETLEAWKEAPGGFVGDMIFPGSLPYDWSPVMRIGMDVGRFALGAINDDAGVLQGFMDRWDSEGQRTLELGVPFYGIAKRVMQAGVAAGVEPLQTWAQDPGGLFKFRDEGPDWKDEDRYAVLGLRDRVSYRTNKEQVYRRLLAPGIPLRTLQNIRQNQLERSLGKIWMENRQYGWDRFMHALDKGRGDEALEILQTHDMMNIRWQDLRRQIDMREMPGWIRSLRGTKEQKFDLITRRWKAGSTSKLEILHALQVHVLSGQAAQLSAADIDLLGRVLRDVGGLAESNGSAR